MIGAPGYGLKITEKLAGFTRAAAVGSGSDVVLEYERWRDTGDQRLLDDIAIYNEEDCRATLVLRYWLIVERPPGTVWWDSTPPTEPKAEVSDARAARLALRDELLCDAGPGSAPWLAGELVEYHRREKRPAESMSPQRSRSSSRSSWPGSTRSSTRRHRSPWPRNPPFLWPASQSGEHSGEHEPTRSAKRLGPSIRGLAGINQPPRVDTRPQGRNHNPRVVGSSPTAAISRDVNCAVLTVLIESFRCTHATFKAEVPPAGSPNHAADGSPITSLPGV